MTQQYNISVDTLTNNFFDTLKERFPHAKLDIRVKSSEPFNGLTKKEFWSIMDCFDWSDAENDADVLEKLFVFWQINLLVKFTNFKIYFQKNFTS